ncbi:MAG: hypothetical protein ACE14L_17420 [Terriglobales bacterium]
MKMVYLDVSQYGKYGLEPNTPAAWVAAASTLIDAHCRRPTLGVEQYTERLRLRRGQKTVRVTYLPLQAKEPATTPLVKVRGRYAAATATAMGVEESAGEIVQVFALAGTWAELDVSAVEYCSETGEITLPMNALGLEFTEAEVTYTAGLAAIPDEVKFACVQIVRNGLATPALNLRASTLDRLHLEYFADTLVDADVRVLLAPWVAQKL